MKLSKEHTKSILIHLATYTASDVKTISKGKVRRIFTADPIFYTTELGVACLLSLMKSTKVQSPRHIKCIKPIPRGVLCEGHL